MVLILKSEVIASIDDDCATAVVVPVNASDLLFRSFSDCHANGCECSADCEYETSDFMIIFPDLF